MESRESRLKTEKKNFSQDPIVSSDELYTIERYLSDESAVFKGFAERVYFPKNEKEVIRVLKDSNLNKTPVTISGSGTGITGSRVPFGGVVISTERLIQVLDYALDKALFEDEVKLSGILRKTLIVKCGGMIVEKGSIHDILEVPCHPFTKYLLESMPKEIRELNKRKRVLLDKEFIKRLTFRRKLRNIRWLIRSRRHCPFFYGCPVAVDVCRHVPTPRLISVKRGHKVACILYP